MDLSNYLIRDLNAIIDSTVLPCAQPPLALATLAGKAAGTMILAVLDFDPRSVPRGYFRPKDRRLVGHFRGENEERLMRGEDGKMHRISVHDAIPDVGREVGKKLPGASFFMGRKIGTAERYFWELESKGEAGLFWWFLMDVAQDGLQKWQSGVCEAKCTSTPLVNYTNSKHNDGIVTSPFWGMTATNGSPSDGIYSIRNTLAQLKGQHTGIAAVTIRFRDDGHTKNTCPFHLHLRSSLHVAGRDITTASTENQVTAGAPGEWRSVTTVLQFPTSNRIWATSNFLSDYRCSTNWWYDTFSSKVQIVAYGGSQ